MGEVQVSKRPDDRLVEAVQPDRHKISSRSPNDQQQNAEEAQTTNNKTSIRIPNDQRPAAKSAEEDQTNLCPTKIGFGPIYTIRVSI